MRGREDDDFSYEVDAPILPSAGKITQAYVQAVGARGNKGSRWRRWLTVEGLYFVVVGKKTAVLRMPQDS